MKNPQSMQDLFNMRREDWLEGARIKAKRLLQTKPSITSEDVTREWPLPKYLHPNTIGSIFRDNDMFHAIGYTKAKRPSSNGRVIRVWTLSDDSYKDVDLDCE